MSKLIVNGEACLRGEISVHGSKNAALPILAATLLIEEPVCLHNCPRLLDVLNMLEILRALGVKATWQGDTLWVDAASANTFALPEQLSKELRSSIFLLGSVLGRFSEAIVTYPGGCAIGNRPIDLHLSGLKKLNAGVVEKGGTLHFTGKPLRGETVHLDYPSVGATENIILSACKAQGQTVLCNAAREPEIVDLQNFLNAAGFCVSGAGTSTIVVEGGKVGHGLSYSIMADRIVAGTYLVAGAITRGDVTVLGADSQLIVSVLDKLKESGCQVTATKECIRLIAPERPQELARVDTLPYPGFPTDMQSQLLALCSVASGTSVIAENIFENRFKHAQELLCMGGCNSIRNQTAIVRGVPRLYGACVTAHDLRGGAALVLAGLRAIGQTTVLYAERIDRGYEQIECALNSLGADIKREES